MQSHGGHAVHSVHDTSVFLYLLALVLQCPELRQLLSLGDTVLGDDYRPRDPHGFVIPCHLMTCYHPTDVNAWQYLAFGAAILCMACQGLHSVVAPVRLALTMLCNCKRYGLCERVR